VDKKITLISISRVKMNAEMHCPSPSVFAVLTSGNGAFNLSFI
jgi:hypothetical protein